MKIENNKIVEATDKELFQNYLNDAWFLLMGYDTYKAQCKLKGTKIIDEEGKIMQTLNDIAESIFLVFSAELFKLSVLYESKGYHSQIAIFDGVSDDNKEWSAFKRIYGECRVTMLEVDFREYEDGKNRIKVCLLMTDTLRCARKQAISDKR